LTPAEAARRRGLFFGYDPTARAHTRSASAMTDSSFLPEWPANWPGALSLALLVLAAAVAGEFAARWRVPRLVGYTLAGFVFALLAYGLAQVDLVAIAPADAELAIGIAAALILFDLGQRVSWGWLQRNPALGATSVAESLLTFGAVFVALRALGMTALPAAMIAAIAIATSPAVVLAVTREVRAQGQLTERVLLLTALNCVYAIVLSTLMLAWAHVESRGVLDTWVLQPLYLVFGALILAAAAAHGMLVVLRYVGSERASQIAVVLACVGVVFALAQVLRLSPLLALLTFGAFARAFDRERRLMAADLGLPAALAALIFFALSFATVDFSLLAPAWLPAIVLVLVRVAAKVAASLALAHASALAWRKGAWLGVGLAPMSAVGLLLSRELAVNYPQLGAQVGAVIFASVFLLQIGGALLLAWALRATGEARQT
jgi:Kef-type K+ transport system membrane component KefB